MADVSRLDYDQFKANALIPLRQFVTRHWFNPARSVEEDELLWYERRFSLLKLAVLLLNFERLNWKRFEGHAAIEPSVDDFPQALARFCADANTYGIEGWAQLRNKMRAKHVETSKKAGDFLRHFIWE